jgi:hypothetical protein
MKTSLENSSDIFSLLDFKEKIIVEDCLKSLEIGDCKNYLTRYYYDSKTNLCIPFNYSGCKGNENNFETLKICEDKCLR